MAESKWFHLQRILELTDNHDTQPTHRPLHCALHFTHRFQILKNKIWHNPAYTGWGKIVHHFERTEFQNRGAAHIHACYWTTENITTMIANHVIRSDMPDATKEPDLYNAVLKHQIHTCIPQKCGGPAPEGLQCRKGFPRKYSPVTYEDKERFRFVYHCVKREDQFVVPYHPATLLMWDAHMNIQYVTSKGLARYMTKYIAKPEPFHTFNIVDNDAYRQHVVGRRLGAMETMFLLLSLPICDSSDQVKFLSTEPPLTRQPSIKPLSLLINNPNEPFWTDSIEKYFARPNSSTFNNMLYVDYFSLYKLTTTRPRQPSKVMQDALGNFVVKRGKKLLIRLRPLSIRDGEHYFYQLLLCKIPARNESDLYNSYPTYRAHFLARYPEETQRLQENSSNFIHSLQERNSLHFHHALDELMSHLNNYIPQRAEQLIKTQLELLRSNPVIHPSAAMLNLPDDQYYALNVITHCLGPKSQSKHPYFFITGSAGTGKTFLIHMLCDLFKNQKKNYLLLAPTGVAAQHIGGHTIHSALRITSAGSFFKTAVLNDSSLRQQVADLDILIIDEISMVSAELFNYLSSLLAEICSNGHAFGGKCIIVVGDLFQLPPVSGEPVFHAACWKSFYPLFLKTQHRQLHDVDFYQTLEKIRVGNIDNETWNKLQNHYYKCKYGHPPVATNAHTSTPPAQTVTYISDPSCTTHLVGFRKDAYRINNAICEQIATKNGSFLIHEATDSVESEIQNIENSEKQFKTKTNLPAVVRLQPGVRVMYLNNTLFSHGICNGSIGIVTSVDPQQKKCTVLFSCQDSFKEIEVTPKYHSFYIDGHLCHRLQFPLQNAFAITVHKAQGLTLQHVTTFLDEQMFDFGQAYVSLSRATSWKNLSICSLSRDAFLTDKRVNGEYNRLQNLSSSSHPPFIIPHHIGTQ
jgi:DNA replication protein DnaC